MQHPTETVICDVWSLAYAQEPSYPEGSREKQSILAPTPAPFEFLREGHRYLFKLSDHRYPAQFWGEVFAYRFGCLMGVRVPSAVVVAPPSANTSAQGSSTSHATHVVLTK